MTEIQVQEVKIVDQDGQQQPEGEVVYSKKFKTVQKSEKRMTKASRRLANAVLAGIETWEKEREKSARKKKDGAMKDRLENYAKAYGESLRRASRAGEDVVAGVKVFMPKKLQKMYGLR